MKEMKNKEKFTEKEWEELASILSDEKGNERILLTSLRLQIRIIQGKYGKN